MLKKLATFEYAINERSMREKILFLLTGMAALIFTWEALVHTPLAKTLKKYDQDTVSARKQISETQVQLKTVLDKIRSDPSKSLNDQRDKLLEEIHGMEVRLAQLMASLVRPNEMIGLLRSFVDEKKSISILSIKNLSPVALTVEKASSSTDKDKQETQKVTMRLYKHGVSLELQGNFFDTLEYLEKLEGLDKKIIWDLIDYQVKEYPLASIRITVTTISDQRSWIGV